MMAVFAKISAFSCKFSRYIVCANWPKTAVFGVSEIKCGKLDQHLRGKFAQVFNGDLGDCTCCHLGCNFFNPSTFSIFPIIYNSILHPFHFPLWKHFCKRSGSQSTVINAEFWRDIFKPSFFCFCKAHCRHREKWKTGKQKWSTGKRHHFLSSIPPTSLLVLSSGCLFSDCREVLRSTAPSPFPLPWVSLVEWLDISVVLLLVFVSDQKAHKLRLQAHVLCSECNSGQLGFCRLKQTFGNAHSFPDAFPFAVLVRRCCPVCFSLWLHETIQKDPW